MRKILLFMGVLLLINSVFLAITTNPHFGHLIQGIVALLIAIYGIFYKKIGKKLHLLIRVLALIPIVIIAFLGIYGNIKTVTFQEDVVIVLGAGLIGEEVGSHLANRLDQTVAYFEKNPDAYIIVCGGLGERQTITEAKAMKRYLVERGIPQDRIIKEDQSTSTYENLVFAQGILKEYFPDGFQAALISNDFHIYRASRMASSIGLEVTHMGASTPLGSWTLNYLRETLAVIRLWAF